MLPGQCRALVGRLEQSLIGGCQQQDKAPASPLLRLPEFEEHVRLHPTGSL